MLIHRMRSNVIPLHGLICVFEHNDVMRVTLWYSVKSGSILGMDARKDHGCALSSKPEMKDSPWCDGRITR